MVTAQDIIDQTKKWIIEVVIGCNFCPFAARVIKQKSVFYKVENSTKAEICLESFLQELTQLDNDDTFETGFLIFPNALTLFNDYLNMVSAAEKLITEKGYDGIYQVASFHPHYIFAGTTEEDAANYTNRSIYPMIHLLRENSINKALELYDNPRDIPDNNIDFARNKGLIYMKMLRNSCI